MDLNLTLVGQMITFAVFVWFTMRFVWPPLQKAMEDRRAQIAQGLEAAEQGHEAFAQARIDARAELETAKKEAATLIDQANQRGRQLIDEAKHEARVEGERLLELAKNEIAQAAQAARHELMQEVAKIALRGAERILEREVSADDNAAILSALVKEVA